MAKAPTKPTANQMSGPARSAPARPTGGGMGSMAGRGGTPTRPVAKPAAARPAPTREQMSAMADKMRSGAGARLDGTVSPNAAKMVGKTFGGMGMKKGGKAKKK